MPIVATSPWSWHSHLAHAVFNQLFQSKQTASLVGWLTYKSPISGKSPIFSWDPPGSELIKRPRFLLVESAPAWDRGETPWFPPDDPTQWVSRIQLPLQGWPTEWIDGEQTLMVVGTEETLNQRPCCLLLVNRPSRHPIDHDCHSKLLIPLLILLRVYSMPQTSLGHVSLLALRP